MRATRVANTHTWTIAETISHQIADQLDLSDILERLIKTKLKQLAVFASMDPWARAGTISFYLDNLSHEDSATFYRISLNDLVKEYIGSDAKHRAAWAAEFRRLADNLDEKAKLK